MIRAQSPGRIASLSRGSVPCEFATRLAVDAGLDVVKIEDEDGDPLRRRSGPLFDFLAAGKRSVVLPSHDPQGALAAIVRRSDAVVVDEAGRERVRAIDPAKPTIVVGARDGSALAGQRADCSEEFLAFHGTGLGYLTPRVMPGYPSAGPLCPDAHLIEFLAGLYGVIALFASLAGRKVGDPGGRTAVVGLTAAALPLLRREVAAIVYEAARPHRSERIWKVSPAEVHRCRDGWVFVDIIEDVQWKRLCDYMQRPDLAADEHYATREKRFARAETLCAILDAFFAERPQSCWIEAQALGIPVAPVNALADLIRDPHLAAREFWARIVDTEGRERTAPSSPLARLFRAGSRAASKVPAVGEHTSAVLAELRA